MNTKAVWSDFFKSLKSNDWPGAVKQANLLIQLEPGNPNHHLKKGDIFQKMGKKAEAVDAYLKAAEGLSREGFERKALAVYKMILRLDPNNITAKKISTHMITGIEAAQTVTLSFALAEGAGAGQDIQAPEEPGRVEIPFVGEHKGKAPEFFGAITDADVSGIIRRAEIKRFAGGETVVQEGDTGDSVYIIRKGKANVVAHILGKEMHLAVLSPGDLFGEVAFLTGRPRTANVIASGALEVYEINRLLLEEIIELKPEIMAEINEIYLSRVKNAIQKVKTE
ncbi:MAG: cyclic nucleotide-binding domain-containing protein [bacterium]